VTGRELVKVALELLAAIGVVVLLFRVGLESNPRKLLRRLPVAGPSLVADVVANAILGFLAARHVVGVPALLRRYPPAGRPSR
jgi:Kef-type K+ transport system membrane component KefB